MSSFEEAIAVTLNSVDFDVDSSPDTNVQASLVLAMDEMRMIRTALQLFAQHLCFDVNGTDDHDYSRLILRNAGLTDPIIGWVLGE